MILLVIAFASINAANSMELSEYKVFYKLTDTATFNALVRYLDVNEEQADQLNYIFDLTERKLNYANKKESTVAAEKAMMFNLGNSKSILNKEQYRKYLIVLNVSRFSDYENLAENK